jgi:hypothetical protein
MRQLTPGRRPAPAPPLGSRRRAGTIRAGMDRSDWIAITALAIFIVLYLASLAAVAMGALGG